MKQLLAELHQRGVRLLLNKDELRVIAKPGALDDALRDTLRLRKPELLEMLRAGAFGTDDGLAALTHDATGRFEPFGLTALQHAYWLGRDTALDMGSVATHLYVELACHDFDLARATQALRCLIDQHDMLRAVIDGDGRQRVLPEVPAYDIDTADCRDLGAATADAQALATRDQLSHQVLKTDRWPLFDIRATLLPSGETRLHVSLDLLILDAWSIFLFFREWHVLYNDLSASTAPEITYRDYLAAEQSHRSGQRYQSAQRYWEGRIDTLPAAPDLPLKADPAARRAPRFSRREMRMERTRWEGLKARGREHGLTPSGLLLAAYAEVLARWSSSPNFTLNVTTGSRQPWHPGVHRLLGDFTSLVLHEVDRRDAAASFSDFAAAQQKRLLQDLEHGVYSGVAVRREWAKRRAAGLQAAMPVVFSSGLVWSGDEEVGNLEQFGPKVFSVSQTSQVWLDHHVMELGGELVLIWDAADGVFEPGVLDAMFGAYTTLVERLADDASAWREADTVALPTAMEQRREEAKRSAMALPRQPLHAAIVAQCRARPGAPAVVATDRSLTMGELLAEGVAVADWLLAQGIAAAEPVALVMRKGWEQVVAVLGTLLAGGAYVPIDADLPVKRQEELLRICATRCLLTQPGALRASQAGASWQAHEIHAGASGVFGPAHQRSLGADLHHTAYVIFTSGTTGTPKGVMIDHAGAVNTVAAINAMFELGPADRVLGVSSLSFDLSVYDIFGVLGAGGTLVLPDAAGGHDAAHWLDLVQRHRVTLWNSAPQLMRMLLDSLDSADTSMATLHTVLLSGDFIPLDLPERLRHHGCTGRIVSLGGATEASIWSVYHPIGEVDPSWQSIPYGRALPNQTISVLDAALRPTPDHVRGRIYIGGSGLATGYLADPAKTAQRFIVHPRSGERLYDTGDLGRYDSRGDIIILGRDDGQVKIRGHRVELGEIEAVLRQHPAIDQAVVLARPGPGGARQLAAYVVARGEAQALDDLRDFAAEHLPDYMLPRHLTVLAEMPLSSNGKVNPAALPDLPAEAEQDAKVGPRNAFEQSILEAWQRVIPGLDIGVTDNFFDLGGDSVLATQLLHELNESLSLRLEMHHLFENLTIESLATLVQRLCDSEADPAEAIPQERSSLLADVPTLLAHTAAAHAAMAAWPASFGLPHESPRLILLTGATGWVGAHVLSELLQRTPARIVCLVRLQNPALDAQAHLSRRLEAFGLRDLPLADRVTVLRGDLQQARFGLSANEWSWLCANVHRIHHLAASVGILQDYAAHRANNVQPLHELLALATTDVLKPIVTLSPMGVCRRMVDGRLQVDALEQVNPDPAGLLTAYAQSKWAAEQILWAAAGRKVPVRIYRSSHALPASASGCVKPNDTYATVLNVASHVETVPDWPAARLHGVPVDHLSALLVEDAWAHGGTSAVVHIEHCTPPALTSVLAGLIRARTGGDEVATVPLEQWQQACLAATAQLPLAHQSLARGLFESRANRMAIENMFSADSIDTGYFASRQWQGRLTELTPPHYWQRALGAQTPEPAAPAVTERAEA